MGPELGRKSLTADFFAYGNCTRGFQLDLIYKADCVFHMVRRGH